MDKIVCFAALIFKMQGDESPYALLNKVITKKSNTSLINYYFK